MGLNELASFEQGNMLFSNLFNRNRCETWSRWVPTAMTKLDLSQFTIILWAKPVSWAVCLEIKNCRANYCILMSLNELASFEQRSMLFSNPSNRNRCETVYTRMYTIYKYIHIYLWSRWVPTAMTKLDLSQFYYYTVSETSILSCLPWNKRIVEQITVSWWVLTSWHLLNKEICCFRTPSIGIGVKLYILAWLLYIFTYTYDRDGFRRLWRSSIYRSCFTIILWAKPVSWAVCLEINELSRQLLYFDGS